MNVASSNHILKWWFGFAVLAFIVQYVQPEEVITSLSAIRPHLLCVALLIPFLIFGRHDIFQWKYPQMKYFWLFTAIMIALTPFSVISGESFVHVQYMLVFGILMSSLLITINSVDNLKIFTSTLLIVTGYIIVRAFLTREATAFAEFQFSRNANYFSDPNELSMFMVMMMPFAYFMFQYEKRVFIKILYMLSLASMVALTILTFSRGGFLALIATALAIWWYTPNKKGTWILISSCIVIIAIISPTLLEMWQDEMSTAVNLSEGTAAGRLELWMNSIKIFLENPIGVGPRATTYYMWEMTNGMTNHISHSIWFTTLAEEGIFGIILLIGLFLKNFKDSTYISQIDVKTEDDRYMAHFALACKVSLIGFAVSGTFITMIYAPHLWYISALIAISMKLYVSKPEGVNVT